MRSCSSRTVDCACGAGPVTWCCYGRPNRPHTVEAVDGAVLAAQPYSRRRRRVRETAVVVGVVVADGFPYCRNHRSLWGIWHHDGCNQPGRDGIGRTGRTTVQLLTCACRDCVTYEDTPGTVPGWLITQRSQVQILSPLLPKGGPDRQVLGLP